MFRNTAGTSSSLNDEDWAFLDVAVKRLEESCRNSESTRLSDYVPPPEHPLHERTLIELIKVDQEYGWERAIIRRRWNAIWKSGPSWARK